MNLNTMKIPRGRIFHEGEEVLNLTEWLKEHTGNNLCMFCKEQDTYMSVCAIHEFDKLVPAIGICERCVKSISKYEELKGMVKRLEEEQGDELHYVKLQAAPVFRFNAPVELIRERMGDYPVTVYDSGMVVIDDNLHMFDVRGRTFVLFSGGVLMVTENSQDSGDKLLMWSNISNWIDFQEIFDFRIRAIEEGNEDLRLLIEEVVYWRSDFDIRNRESKPSLDIGRLLSMIGAMAGDEECNDPNCLVHNKPIDVEAQ